MTTHYIRIWAKMNVEKGLAVCKRFVDYASDSDQPTCEDCRRLIATEDNPFSAASQLRRTREAAAMSQAWPFGRSW